MKITELKPNKANPRTIKDDKFKKLVASVKDFPKMMALRPIVIDADGTILGGNMRYRALVELGYKEIPDNWVKRASDLTDEEKKRFIIEDNIPFGEWDWDALADTWDEAELKDWGLDVWQPLDEDTEDETPSEVTEDDFDEDGTIEVRCKKGDIWELGEHRLMCGDSIDLEQVKTLMGGGLSDMVFTDPPYGVAIGDKNKVLNSVQKAGRCTENIKNDTLSVEELYKVLKVAFDNARLNCKDDACYFVAAPPGGDMGLMMMMMMQDAGLRVRHQLVWNKNSATFSLGRLDYDYKHEAILYTWTKSHHNYRKGKFRTSVWDIDKPRKCNLHPTMKPVELVANCMLDGSKEGDIVLDLFGGSGTTIIAAEQLGRKARVMEIDPHYCDVIIQRWEEFTGEKATKVG